MTATVDFDALASVLEGFEEEGTRVAIIEHFGSLLNNITKFEYVTDTCAALIVKRPAKLTPDRRPNLTPKE